MKEDRTSAHAVPGTGVSPEQMHEAEQRIRRMVAEGACDLHLHTNASDGTTPPDVLVRMVAAGGLRAFSVTDHDTIAALPVVRAELEEIGENAPQFVPGVELSVDYEVRPGRAIEVHLLGYFPLGGIEAVEDWLREMRGHRRERNRQMCSLLTRLGMPITLEELEAEGEIPDAEEDPGDRPDGDIVVGRVQAANILVRKGFAQDRRDAFNRYLGPGRPGYAPRERPGLRSAIEFLASHGGLPVLAHPHVYRWTGDAAGLEGHLLVDVLRKLHGWGLSGVEAFHGEATPEVRAEVLAAGLAAGLLITAGSDFHGGNKHAAMYTAETDFSAGL